MTLVPVGAIGTANKTDVLEGETFSSKNAGTNATGTIPNNGNATITEPNDTLSGNGYYSSISNSITDRGVLDINGPSDSGNAGYYDRIDNNIADQGSIGNLNPGEYGNAGYYSGGSVNEAATSTKTYTINSAITLGNYPTTTIFHHRCSSSNSLNFTADGSDVGSALDGTVDFSKNGNSETLCSVTDTDVNVSKSYEKGDLIVIKVNQDGTTYSSPSGPFNYSIEYTDEYLT